MVLYQLSYATCPSAEIPIKVTCLDLANKVVDSCEKKIDLEAKTKKQRYSFNVCNNGKFELELNTYFPYAESAEEVFTKYFLNGESIKKTSNLLRNTAPKVIVDEKEFQGDAKKLIGKRFNFESHPKKNFSTKSFISNCSLAQTGTALVQICHVSMSNGDGKEAFKSGKNNSTTIKCSKENDGVTCNIIIQGTPKDINGILYSNTAEKLAVSGAIESLGDFFNLSFLAHGCEPGPASENISGSTFYKTNIKPFWKKITSKVENLAGEKSLVSVSSGQDEINIKLYPDTKAHNDKNIEKVLDCQ